MAVGRYSLKVNDEIIKIPWDFGFLDINALKMLELTDNFKNKDKVPLSIIDAFTTRFNDEEEMCDYLQIPNNSDIKLIYQIKQEKSLPIALNCSDITVLARNNFGDSKLIQSDKEKIRFKLMKMAYDDEELYHFLCKTKYVNSKINEYTVNCLRYIATEDYDLYKSKLENNLTYRIARDMLMGIDDYYDALRFISSEEESYQKQLRR